MRWNELSEAPIADFETKGDMSREGSFRDSDLRAINNPKWVTKVTDLYAKVPFPINLYLNNVPGGLLKRAFGDINLLDPTNAHIYAGAVTVAHAETIIGRIPDNYEQALNVILMTNEGSGRIALTPWMVGHRVVHAIMYEHQKQTYGAARRVFSQFGNMMSAFASFMDNHKLWDSDVPLGLAAQQHEVAKFFGTTRAARLGIHENDGEWIVDIMTQWLVLGRVKMNKPNICPAGRSAPLPEIKETRLSSLAKYFYIRYDIKDPQEFTNWLTDKKHYMEKVREPDLSSPGLASDDFLAVNDQGLAFAHFSDEANAQKYIDQGLKIERYTIAEKIKQAQKEYAAYLRKTKKIAKDYSEWVSTGAWDGRPSTPTDRLYDMVERHENELNKVIAELFDASLGNFYRL